MAIPYRIVIPSKTILVSRNILPRPAPHGAGRVRTFKELCRCPHLQETVGVGVYKSYNPIVVFRVGVAQPSALHHLAQAQRELHGLDTVALTVVC